MVIIDESTSSWRPKPRRHKRDKLGGCVQQPGAAASAGRRWGAMQVIDMALRLSLPKARPAFCCDARTIANTCWGRPCSARPATPRCPCPGPGEAPGAAGADYAGPMSRTAHFWLKACLAVALLWQVAHGPIGALMGCCGGHPGCCVVSTVPAVCATCLGCAACVSAVAALPAPARLALAPGQSAPASRAAVAHPDWRDAIWRPPLHLARV